RATIRHRDHAEGVVAPLGRQRRAVDRVDGDVVRATTARSDVLAVEKHRRIVLLALTDHDAATDVDRREEGAHGVHGRAVRELLLTTPDERHRADGGRLCGTYELERNVAVGRQGDQVVGVVDLVISGHAIDSTQIPSQETANYHPWRVKESLFLTFSTNETFHLAPSALEFRVRQAENRLEPQHRY